MQDPDAWKSDPLVKVQDTVWPVMWMGGRVVLNHQLGRDQQPDWQSRFNEAAEMLSTTGIGLMKDYGVTITSEDQQIFSLAADRVLECRNALELSLSKPATPQSADEFLNLIQTKMQPAVSAAIDRYRMVFINLVVARQSAHTEQTNSAISGLDQISKQIFFISINASVEAARAGDAGRGFLQISTDIRALSQSAQDATRSLSNLVADSRRAH